MRDQGCREELPRAVDETLTMGAFREARFACDGRPRAGPQGDEEQGLQRDGVSGALHIVRRLTCGYRPEDRQSWGPPWIPSSLTDLQDTGLWGVLQTASWC